MRFIFSTFSCEAFSDDDTARTSRSFLHTDSAVECYTHEHYLLIALASSLIVVWPVGVPALFVRLLRTVERAEDAASRALLVHAVGFLHAEYKSEPAYCCYCGTGT